jgi:alpha-tubulin suppressor-like RCC1 family protein
MIQVGGVFYGTTQSGGLGYGGVYSVNTAGQVTLIHAFTGGTSDGAIPFAGLVLGSDGNLYGTTTNGGLNKNGTVFGWINFAPTPSLVSGISNATLLVGAPDDHYAVLLSDGTLKLWGANGSGQLGNGTTSQYYTSTPVSMTNLGAIKQVAVGAGFTLILKSDGTVWSWGDNAYGQLGNGTTVSSLVPVQVTGLSNVASISTSWYHCFAIMSD